MDALDKKFTGSIPDIYDEFLVPLIFESFAEDMSSRVADLKPLTVLETAAGSGVVTRALAPRLGEKTQYFVTDLNPPMIARAQAQQPENANIHWKQADALALPFDSGCFEVVCCQFGAMFFPDKTTGYREAHRVLAEDGKFIFNMWDGIEHNEFAQSVTQTAADFFPDDPPNFLPRTPHGHGDISVIKEQLTSVGFGTVKIETLTHASRAPSGMEPAMAYLQGTPLRNEIEARDGSLLAEITQKAAAEIEEKFGLGPVISKIQGHVIVATK